MREPGSGKPSGGSRGSGLDGAVEVRARLEGYGEAVRRVPREPNGYHLGESIVFPPAAVWGWYLPYSVKPFLEPAPATGPSPPGSRRGRRRDHGRPCPRRGVAGGRVCSTAVSLGELYFGAFHSTHRLRNLRRLARIRRWIVCLPFDERARRLPRPVRRPHTPASKFWGLQERFVSSQCPLPR